MKKVSFIFILFLLVLLACKLKAPFQKSKIHEDTEGEFTQIYAELKFDPTQSKLITPCTSIKLVQVVQTCVDGKPINPQDFSQQINFQASGTVTIDDLQDTPKNEKGKHVDKDVLGGILGQDNAGVGIEGKTASTQNSGGITSPIPATDAELSDEPNTNGGDKGFKSPDNPNGYNKVTFKFEVCAHCFGGQDVKHTFECMTWEYERTADDFTNGKPGKIKFTGQKSKPSKGFKKALNKFHEKTGYTYPS